MPTISLGATWLVEMMSEIKLAVMPMIPAKHIIWKQRMMRKVFAIGAAPYVGIAMLIMGWS